MSRPADYDGSLELCGAAFKDTDNQDPPSWQMSGCLAIPLIGQQLDGELIYCVVSAKSPSRVDEIGEG